MQPFTLPHRILHSCLAVTLAGALQAQDGPEPSRQPPSHPGGIKVAAELAEKAKTRIKKVDDTNYTLGSMQFNSATREIRIPTLVNMSEGILEYAVVHEHGKTHESLLKTSISPTEFNVALLLCHYEPHIKEAAQYLEDPLPETKAKMALPMEREGANRVLLTVEWKDKDGKTHTAPLSDWVRDVKEAKPLKTDHWTYTGSFVSLTGYAAEDDGSLIAIYFDLVSIMNLPNPGNRSDDRWVVEKSAVPPIDTPVTLIISQPKPVAPAPAPKS